MEHRIRWENKNFDDMGTLKETSTLKANRRLLVGNTVLFQILVESPVMRYHSVSGKTGFAYHGDTYICF